jgi:hypothetical protein
MISMFDLKNSKKWQKISCIIVTSYWKVQCGHFNHDPISTTTPFVQTCSNVSSYIHHTTRWWHVLLLCFNISQHLVFWRWIWKVKLCLTKTTHHISTSPLKKDWIQSLNNLDVATFLSMHLENKLTIVDLLLKAIQIRGFIFPYPNWWPH